MQTELIVKLKEGVSFETIFPASLMENSLLIKIERLNDIPLSNDLSSKTLNEISFFDNAERENFIQKEVLPKLDEAERGLYRIFKIQVPVSTDPGELKKTLEENPGVEYVQFNQKKRFDGFAIGRTSLFSIIRVKKNAMPRCLEIFHRREYSCCSG
jgi:hypothetical protein